MQIIVALFIGLIVGALAKLIRPGRDPGGIIVTSLIGVAGSLLATFLGRAMGLYGPEEPAGFLASIVGAILVLMVYSGLNRRRIA